MGHWSCKTGEPRSTMRQRPLKAVSAPPRQTFYALATDLICLSLDSVSELPKLTLLAPKQDVKVVHTQ